MKIGKLRHRVSLQANTPTQGANGELTPSWANVATGIPCEVESPSGGETIRGRQVSATTSHVVTMRWRDDITPRHRLIWGEETLYVRSAMDATGLRRELTVECGRTADG